METLAVCAVVAVVGLSGAYVYTKTNRDSSPDYTVSKFMSNFKFGIDEEMEGFYFAHEAAFGKMPCTFYIYKEGNELKLFLKDEQGNTYILTDLYPQLNVIQGKYKAGDEVTIYNVEPKRKQLLGGKRRRTRSRSSKGRKSQRRR